MKVFWQRLIFILVSLIVVTIILVYYGKKYEKEAEFELNVILEKEENLEKISPVVLIEENVEPKQKRTCLGEFLLTAYCACELCCEEYALNRPIDENGKAVVYGSIGDRLFQGVSIAVDPAVIPYGTRVDIDGHVYIAQDCGGAIQGNRIDVYFDNHDDALRFGVQEKIVYVVTEAIDG